MVKKKKLKILHTSTIPLSIKAFNLSFLSYIKEKYFDVHVATSPGKEEKDIIDAGIPFFPVKISRTIKPFNDLKAILQLFMYMREEKFDILHTQTAKAGYVSRVAGWMAGIPIIIYTAHAFPFHAFLNPLRKRAYIFLEKLAAKITDIILVDTETVRHDGIKKRIKAPEKIITVNMGINLHKFSPDRVNRSEVREKLGIKNYHFVVGTVSSFVPNKGLDFFLKIAEQLKKEEMHVKFLMVGDGPMRPQLELLTDKFKLREDVNFTGFRDDIPEMMSAMDIFCLPTLREGFGVVFAEAMAMKVPIVTSMIHPIPEVVINNETGILVPLGDTDQFVKAIGSLIYDKNRRYELGEKGRKRVEQYFDEKLMFERTLRIYADLIRLKGL